MYQALYRKYRPQVFSDVVGQPHITTTLKNEINAGKHSHAYLFTGSRGTGKTTCAKIFAKAVNCLNPQNGDPCNECEVCKGIDNGSIMDVIEIDAASNNGVDNIRDLREEVNFTPVNTKYRVYIIDEVHMLSIGAFNALLKTLEEPPEHVKFVLATTEVHKLPATILSRCQRFDFHRIQPEDIAKRLTYVAQQEGVSLENEAAILIARLSDGALRDALSILDQCIVKTKDITVEIVDEVVGIASSDYLFRISESMIEKNSALALETIDILHNHSCDMERLCDELINHFRNIMIVKTVKNPQNLIVCTDSEIEQYKENASKLDMDSVLYAIDVLGNALSNLRRGLNRRVEMEMTVIKLCSSQGVDNLSLEKRIKVLESALAGGEFKAPVVRDVTPVKKAPEVKTLQPAKTPVTPKPMVSQPKPKAQDLDLPFDVDDDVPPPIENMAPPAEEVSYDAPVKDVPNEIDNPFAALKQESEILDNMNSAPALQEEPVQNVSDSVPADVKDGEVEPQKWLQVIRDIINGDKALIGTMNSSSAFVNGNKLLIQTDNKILEKLINMDMHKDAIHKSVKKVLGRDFSISLVKENQQKTKNVSSDPLDNFINNAKGLNFDFKIEE